MKQTLSCSFCGLRRYISVLNPEPKPMKRMCRACVVRSRQHFSAQPRAETDETDVRIVSMSASDLHFSAQPRAETDETTHGDNAHIPAPLDFSAQPRAETDETHAIISSIGGILIYFSAQPRAETDETKKQLLARWFSCLFQCSTPSRNR